MTAIISALSAGVSAQQILNFLIKQSPAIGSRIQSMLAAGLSAEKIVNLFTNKENFQQLKQSIASNMMNPAQAENPLVLAERIRTEGRAQDTATRATEGIQSLAKAGAGIGATALGAYALNRALPAAANFLGGGQPPPPSTPPVQPTSPQLGNANPNNMPPQQPGPGSPSSPVAPAAGPNNPGQAVPPPVQIQNVQKHVDIIKQLGLENHIKRQEHLTPQDIAATVEFMTSPGQKKWIAEQTNAPIEQIVTDYLGAVGRNPQPASPIAQQPNPTTQGAPPAVTPEIEQPKQPEIPIANAESAKPQVTEEVKPYIGKNVGSIVSVGGLPGRIESIKKDIAKVNVDGRIRHLKLKDVEEAPEDVKEAVIRLLNIPDRDKSAVTAYFGYNPESQSLAVQYHNGNLYTYDDVPQGIIHQMASKLGIPITTGGNIFGEWEQGKQDSVGAALIAEIIKDPKYARENKNKTWRKYETGYDYWEKLRQKPKPRVPKSKESTKRASKKSAHGKKHSIPGEEESEGE